MQYSCQFSPFRILCHFLHLESNRRGLTKFLFNFSILFKLQIAPKKCIIYDKEPKCFGILIACVNAWLFHGKTIQLPPFLMNT